MSYPATLDSFTTHVSGDTLQPTDVNNLNTAASALEAKVGVDASAVTTTLDYLAKNSNSNGGGHVQTVATGGTGKTSLTAYALLAAGTTSTGMLQQVSGLGSANQVLTSTGAGTLPTWQSPQTSKVYTSASQVMISNSIAETTLLTAPITGGILGTANALRIKFYITQVFNGVGTNTLTLRVKYGSTTLYSDVTAPVDSSQGSVEVVVLANASTNAQSSLLEFREFKTEAFNKVHIANGTAAEDSTTTLNLVVTAQRSISEPNSFIANYFTVEKIV